MSQDVLLVGNNESLLSTRAKVLEASGMTAEACTPAELSAMKVAFFHMVILCHTLGVEQMQRALEQIRRGAPGIPVVKVRSMGSIAGENLTQPVQTVSPHPAEIVKHVLTVLGRIPAEAPSYRRIA